MLLQSHGGDDIDEAPLNALEHAHASD